jgi:hypothetical protein
VDVKIENRLDDFHIRLNNECLLTHNQVISLNSIIGSFIWSGYEPCHFQRGRHHVISLSNSFAVCLNAGFGQAPQGAQLSLVEQSPHYRDGQFHNQLPTPGFTGQKNMLAAWWEFLVTKRENARPAQPLPLVNTDLASLPRAGYDGVARPLLLVSAAGGETHPDRPGLQQLCRAVLVY